MIETIQVFKALIDNPIGRNVLKNMCNYCREDRENRLEVALELYANMRKGACLKCRLMEKALVAVLRSGSKAFKVTEEEMKRTFKDPYWRRGLASVVKGLSVFTVRKPFTPGAPFQVVWEVLQSCNLRCKYCSAYTSVGKDELTTEEALETIDKIDELGVAIIAFSGGEPLIRNDLFKLTRYAADRGIYVAIATNGTLITKEKAEEMKRAGIEYVQISLDGATPKVHNSIRGVAGAFDKTIQGIKNMVTEGFFTNVSTTIIKENYHEIPKIIDLCEKLHVDWFTAYNFIPTGRGKGIKNMDLDPEEREELLMMLYERTRKSKVRLLSTAPQYARAALELETCQESMMIPTHFYNIKAKGRLGNLAEFIGGCGAGRFYFAIKPNGDIQPCVFFPLKLGNIKDADLKDLWENSTILEELRDKDLLKGYCSLCEYRYYCGGCRARAYSYFGDYLADDPGCIKVKEEENHSAVSNYCGNDNNDAFDCQPFNTSISHTRALRKVDSQLLTLMNIPSWVIDTTEKNGITLENVFRHAFLYVDEEGSQFLGWDTEKKRPFLIPKEIMETRQVEGEINQVNLDDPKLKEYSMADFLKEIGWPQELIDKWMQYKPI